MYKYLFTFSLLLLPLRLFCMTYEIPFNLQNKEKFYLSRSKLVTGGIAIAKEMNKGKNIFSPQLSIMNFEQLNRAPQFQPKNISLIKDSQIGEQSALFYNKNSFIKFPFYGNFDKGISIEFWAKPFTTESGQIFSTQSLNPSHINKELIIFFRQGKLIIRFQNLFVSYKDIHKPLSLEIQSKSLIPSNKWGFHRLEYNPSNGQINYYFNNNLESQTWATSNNLADDSLLFFNLPKKSSYVLGKGYRGLMDQFLLSSGKKENFEKIFEKSYIFTKVINLKGISSIYNVSLDSFYPQDTDTKIEYRYALLPFTTDIPDSLIPWHEMDSTKNLGKDFIKAKYIQFKLTLFRDPTFYKSPLVKKLSINYSLLDIPTKPVDVEATSNDGTLRLSFREIFNENVAAFKIYLGSKRAQYFGEPNIGLDSPILVPRTALIQDRSTGRLSYKIDGLMVDKLYFFRITAISTDGVESEMSQEKAIRIHRFH
jgi:hypothetical protein